MVKRSESEECCPKSVHGKCICTIYGKCISTRQRRQTVELLTIKLFQSCWLSVLNYLTQICCSRPLVGPIRRGFLLACPACRQCLLLRRCSLGAEALKCHPSRQDLSHQQAGLIPNEVKTCSVLFLFYSTLEVCLWRPPVAVKWKLKFLF